MVRRIFTGLVMLVAAALASGGAAIAQDAAPPAAPAGTPGYVALVVSNAVYDEVGSLTNAEADADAVASTLSSLGYAVDRRKDLDYGAFRGALLEFQGKASQADAAVIYYSGYGIRVDRSGYLVPVDAALRSAATVEFEAVPVDLVMHAASGGKGVRVVILDAFRANPFVGRMGPSSRPVASGLADVAPPARDMLVAFPAKAGTMSAGGTGAMSPYVDALVAKLSEPGIDLNTLFAGVGERVRSATGGAQEPVVFGQVSGPNVFLTPTPRPQVGASGDPCRFAEAHWNAAVSMNKESFYEEHLQLFGSCPFASFARVKLAELRAGGAGAVAAGAAAAGAAAAGAAAATAAGDEPPKAAAKPAAKKKPVRRTTAKRKLPREQQPKRKTNVFDPACRGNTGFGMCN